MGLYEFKVNELCEKYSQKRLAELLLNMTETKNTYKADNDLLREENESLRYLIAKHRIEKMGGGE